MYFSAVLACVWCQLWSVERPPTKKMVLSLILIISHNEEDEVDDNVHGSSYNDDESSDDNGDDDSDGNDDDGMCLVSSVISSPPTQSENRDQFRADYFTTSRPDVPHHFWAIAHSPDWLILTKLLAITAQKCPDYSGTA